MKCQKSPRKCQAKLKKRIQELNSKWDIFPTPNGTVGVQQSLEERLRM